MGAISPGSHSGLDLKTTSDSLNKELRKTRHVDEMKNIPAAREGRRRTAPRNRDVGLRRGFSDSHRFGDYTAHRGQPAVLFLTDHLFSVEG